MATCPNCDILLERRGDRWFCPQCIAFVQPSSGEEVPEWVNPLTGEKFSNPFKMLDSLQESGYLSTEESEAFKDVMHKNPKLAGKILGLYR